MEHSDLARSVTVYHRGATAGAVAAPARQVRSGRRPRSPREAATGMAFVTPAMLLLLVFFVVPIFFNLYISLTSYSPGAPAKFIGLHNYSTAARSSAFIHALAHTFVFAIGTTLASIALGFAIASVLNQLRGRAFRVFRLAFYLPGLTSVSVSALLWLYLYDPQVGILNRLLAVLHLPPQQWLQDPHLALACIIAMAVWMSLGFSMLVYLGGLQNIPHEIIDASRVDGAGPLTRAIRVVAPMLRPVTVFIGVVLFIQSMQVFSEVYIMTNGGPLDSTTTSVLEIYKAAFTNGEFGLAAAMSFVMFAMLVVLGLVGVLARSRSDRS